MSTAIYALALTIAALAVTACGGTDSAPTTQDAAPAPVSTVEQDAAQKWIGLSRFAREEVCQAIADADVNKALAYVQRYPQDFRDAFLDAALPDCDDLVVTEEERQAAAAERKAEREREAAEAAERERQRKIKAVGKSSLTAAQKVAVFDAVCDYLNTPGA